MLNPRTRLALVGLFWIVAFPALGADGPVNVAEIKAAHDRALVRDLSVYLAGNPKADDVDQGFMTLFDKVIEHDWFADHEALASRYLTARPDGPVRSLAQIVATMARAQADDFTGALARYDDLLKSLGKPEQEEFAANFADSLATAATAAGEYPVARRVYRRSSTATPTARTSFRRSKARSPASTRLASPPPRWPRRTSKATSSGSTRSKGGTCLSISGPPGAPLASPSCRASRPRTRNTMRAGSRSSGSVSTRRSRR